MKKRKNEQENILPRWFLARRTYGGHCNTRASGGNYPAASY